MNFFFSLLCISQLFVLNSYGQFADSLQIHIGTISTFASENHQPLWIVSNRFGSISDQKSDFSSYLHIYNTHSFSFLPALIEKDTGVFFQYGLTLFNNQNFQRTFFQEAFLKAGYKNWEIQAGRFQDIIGEIDPQLSSGSFAVSGNALPIPKIGIAVSDYVDVPFTKGFLQFKGQLSHGWFGNNHSVERALLHEKALYLKAGKDKFKFFAGLSHFAQWGGEHHEGPMPSRFKDYLRIIVGAPGDPNDPVYQYGAGSIDVDNAVGNHMITSDIGFQLGFSKSIIRLYTQTIFSKGRGDSSNVNRRDDLIGLNMFGKDRMIGLSWTSRKKSWLEKVLLEGIYTKDQGGDIIFNGRFNYYNNATYTTGWVYMDQIIGTPLFISQNQAEHYGLNPNNWSIMSNRVIGLHTGISGSIGSKFFYRGLFTIIQHHGNYYNDSMFTPPKRQSHFLTEFSYQVKGAISLKAMVARDSGDLSDNIGVGIGVEYKLL